MRDRGFIHTDIKPDNLMFNVSEDEYVAKIIDLVAVYNSASVDTFVPVSQEYASNRDITQLIEISKNESKIRTETINGLFNRVSSYFRTNTINGLFNQLIKKYDLHCLSKSFLHKFRENKEFQDNFVFKSILINCSVDRFEDRFDCDRALKALDALELMDSEF